MTLTCLVILSLKYDNSSFSLEKERQMKSVPLLTPLQDTAQLARPSPRSGGRCLDVSLSSRWRPRSESCAPGQGRGCFNRQEVSEGLAYDSTTT